MMKAYSLSEIDGVAQQVLKQSTSKTLLFYGEMGAGKTTLIKALAKALGSQDPVSSPTFSLVNEYESSHGPIFHFDFYRIQDKFEALDIGFEDYLDTNAWKFVEWPQKIVDFLEFNPQKIEISILEKEERMLKLC